MRVAVFSSKPYDRQYLGAAAQGSPHQLDFFEAKLNCDHVPLAADYDAVCVFVHDEVSGDVLRTLAEGGTRLVALRAAGFNNVDLEVAKEVGIRVCRVPAYSPYAVAVKPGVMIVTTSRGALIDTEAAIDALKDGRIGYLGLDVYEEEDAVGFFEDQSQSIIQDDTFARLLTFPNVLITAHQAFFTSEALANIADTTIANLTAFEEQGEPVYEVSAD